VNKKVIVPLGSLDIFHFSKEFKSATDPNIYTVYHIAIIIEESGSLPIPRYHDWTIIYDQNIPPKYDQAVQPRIIML
jgi:hypothetical protein